MSYNFKQKICLQVACRKPNMFCHQAQKAFTSYSLFETKSKM